VARIASIAIGLSGSISGLCRSDGCPEHFGEGQAPDFINQKLTAQVAGDLLYRLRCHAFRASTRTPLYAGEHLTKNGLILRKNEAQQQVLP